MLEVMTNHVILWRLDIVSSLLCLPTATQWDGLKEAGNEEMKNEEMGKWRNEEMKHMYVQNLDRQR